ncbi:uncharacterized protein LOC112530295 isoform X2 [Gallus gallus]|uniref:uncharacterized protein LOC112530295 isoform X2 n=1 Tax=Gallus gallus TaxID=9031 RepID=UPI001AEBA422|nr:uncharacterized protein LOC112530295 isoform X2 [Gallus gallus]
MDQWRVGSRAAPIKARGRSAAFSFGGWRFVALMVVRRPVLICPGRALRAAASVPEQHHCCGLLQQDLAELCTPIGIASVPTVTVRPFSVELRVQSPADWQSCIHVLLLNDGVSAGSSCEGPLLTLQDAFLLLWFGAPQDGPSSSAPPPTPGGLCLCFHPCRFPSSRPRRPLRRGWPRPFGSHRDGWTPSRSPLSLPFSGLNSPGSLSLSSQGDAPGPASPLSPPLGSLQEIAVCFVLGARN